MKSSVFEHTWMQGKPNEIGYEVYWNEYIVKKHSNEIGYEVYWNEYIVKKHS